MDLVIVESPSKSKTISKYLGSGYKVLASGGHVRDLPADKLGVNVHRNFEPEYEVYPQKENTIKQLKKEIKNCEKIYLATDPDREGEAISWHLKNILGIDGDNVRIVFNDSSNICSNSFNTSDIRMNLLNNILGGRSPRCNTYAAHRTYTFRIKIAHSLNVIGVFTLLSAYLVQFAGIGTALSAYNNHGIYLRSYTSSFYLSFLCCIANRI